MDGWRCRQWRWLGSSAVYGLPLVCLSRLGGYRPYGLRNTGESPQREFRTLRSGPPQRSAAPLRAERARPQPQVQIDCAFEAIRTVDHTPVPVRSTTPYR